MKDSLDDLRGALSALAPAKRFELLTLAIQSERCVGDLARASGLSQSCTTRHLQALERAGLVRGVRSGKRVMIRIDPRSPELGELVSRIRALLERVDIEGDISVAEPIHGARPERSSGPPARPGTLPTYESADASNGDHDMQAPPPRSRHASDLDDFLL